MVTSLQLFGNRYSSLLAYDFYVTSWLVTCGERWANKNAVMFDQNQSKIMKSLTIIWWMLSDAWKSLPTWRHFAFFVVVDLF